MKTKTVDDDHYSHQMSMALSYVCALNIAWHAHSHECMRFHATANHLVVSITHNNDENTIAKAHHTSITKLNITMMKTKIICCHFTSSTNVSWPIMMTIILLRIACLQARHTKIHSFTQFSIRKISQSDNYLIIEYVFHFSTRNFNQHRNEE